MDSDDELVHENYSGSGLSITAEDLDRIVRNHGSWEEEGLKAGQQIRLIGSHKGYDGVYTIVEITSDGRILVLDLDEHFTENETLEDYLIVLVGLKESNVIVNAKVRLPDSETTAKAKASGIAGSGVVSGSFVLATAEVRPTVNAYFGEGLELDIDGSVQVIAEAHTKQEAYTDTINVGVGVAFGKNTAEVVLDSKITADIGDNTKIRAYEVLVKAYGLESAYAEAISGGGGIISGSRTEAKTENKNNTTASVGEVQIDVVAFDLLAEHKLDYNSLAGIDLDISVLGRSGAAEAYNNVNTTVLAKVGKNAKITANDILIGPIIIHLKNG